MAWHKQGLIYALDRSLGWAEHSAAKPAPIRLDERRVRVFLGCRDRAGISRIGWVDLDARDLSRVLGSSPRPVLDLGAPGMFDDNGVVPCVAFRKGGDLFLYYEGYQLGTKVKFLSFAGLAVSRDDGASFERYDVVPVLDRAAEGSLIRVVHDVQPLPAGGWRVYYTAGSSFVTLGATQHPSYEIFVQDSPDATTFAAAGRRLVTLAGDEYRVGKPSVAAHAGGQLMLFSRATRTTPYRLGAARSRDGVVWERGGDELLLPPSPAGWDSQMIAYPYLLDIDGTLNVLYNGNNYGETGFGYAVWRD